MKDPCIFYTRIFYELLFSSSSTTAARRFERRVAGAAGAADARVDRRTVAGAVDARVDRRVVLSGAASTLRVLFLKIGAMIVGTGPYAVLGARAPIEKICFGITLLPRTGLITFTTVLFFFAEVG